jgi:hypothetical protein
MALLVRDFGERAIELAIESFEKKLLDLRKKFARIP